MYCEHCGREIKNNLRFCSYCGFNVDKKYNFKCRRNIVMAFGMFIICILMISGALIAWKRISAEIVKRNLQNAQDMLDVGQYEAAIEYYEKVLKVNNKCVQGYLGEILSFINMEDTEEARYVFEKAIGVIARLNPKEVQEMKDIIVDIYCTAEQIYRGEYDFLLKVYEKAESIDPGNYQINQLKRICLSEGIDFFCKIEDFDSAINLIEGHKNYINSADFALYETKVKQEKQLSEDRHIIINNILRFFINTDYSGLCAYLNKTDLTILYDIIEQDKPYLYLQEGVNHGDTGKSLGIYKYSTYVYYYYGEYVNRERCGMGVSFYVSDEDGCYAAFEGVWENDAPNGKGILTDYDANSDIFTIIEGEYKNGLQNGIMCGKIETNGDVLTTQWNAVEGTVSDITGEYSFLDWSQIVKDGYTVYAIYTDYEKYVFMSAIEKNGKLGTIGYGTLGK